MTAKNRLRKNARLEEIDVEEVSGVDRAANNRTFAVIKAEGGDLLALATDCLAACKACAESMQADPAMKAGVDACMAAAGACEAFIAAGAKPGTPEAAACGEACDACAAACEPIGTPESMACGEACEALGEAIEGEVEETHPAAAPAAAPAAPPAPPAMKAEGDPPAAAPAAPGGGAKAHEVLLAERAEAIKAGVTKLLGAIDSQDFAEASALLSAMQDAAWSIRDTLGIVKLSKSADGVVVGKAEATIADVLKSLEGKRATLKKAEPAPDAAAVEEEKRKARIERSAARLVKAHGGDRTAAIKAILDVAEKAVAETADDDAVPASKAEGSPAGGDLGVFLARIATALEAKADPAPAAPAVPNAAESTSKVLASLSELSKRVAQVEKGIAPPLSTGAAGSSSVSKADDGVVWPTDLNEKK